MWPARQLKQQGQEQRHLADDSERFFLVLYAEYYAQASAQPWHAAAASTVKPFHHLHILVLLNGSSAVLPW